MREANLLVMLAMLAGHAGDVENDADDVDGRVKYVHFARNLQHFSSQDGKQTKKSQIKSRPSSLREETLIGFAIRMDWLFSPRGRPSSSSTGTIRLEPSYAKLREGNRPKAEAVPLQLDPR